MRRLVTLVVVGLAVGACSTTTLQEETEVPGAIVVAVEGVVGHSGWELAGVLFDGVGFADPDHGGIGGFAVAVDDDSFSTRQIIRTPAHFGDGPFPYVTDDILTVEPGVYSLVVYLGSDIRPYSRWVPGMPEGDELYGCQTVAEVEEGLTVTVTVTSFTTASWTYLPLC